MPDRRDLLRALPRGLTALTAACGVSPLPARAADTGWPGFRGPNASGIAEGFPLPERWNVERGEGLRWRTPLPGLGHSSPIVWGDRLYLLTAISGRDNPELRAGLYGDIAPVQDDSEHRWLLLALETRTGRVAWQREIHRGVPRIRRHPKATHANSTLATDGRRLVAFLGSEGLWCWDMSGRLRWRKDLGLVDSGYFAVPTAQWGSASSPVLWEDRVFVQCDRQQHSFVAAYNAADGRELWRTPREEVPTWSTPAVAGRGRDAQVILNGYRHIGGYDAHTGAELWKLRGGGDIPVPTPVVWRDLVLLTSAHGQYSPIYAVKLGARGDITPATPGRPSAGLAWSQAREGAYMPTPLVYRDHLYVLRDQGVLGCYEAATGRRLYQERLGAGPNAHTASPVAGDGKLYCTGEEGNVTVVRAGPRCEVLATNPLGALTLATPAIARGDLYFRTRDAVLAVRRVAA